MERCKAQNSVTVHRNRVPMAKQPARHVRNAARWLALHNTVGDGIVQANQGEQCDGSICCNDSCKTDTASCDVCLLISEYYEGAGNDKAVELYNCENTALNLSGIHLCTVRNADTTCIASRALSGTIPPCGTFTLCNSMGTIPTQYCDVQEPGEMVFNGDDRLALFINLDGMVGLSGTDVVIDAFGETAARPIDLIWQNVSYSRCNFTQYSGVGFWDVGSYFNTSAPTQTGLKQPPTQGCN